MAKDKGGRPTKFTDEMLKQVTKLCLLGATDKQIADFFEVAESTIYEWKNKIPEFSEAIKKGKIIADTEVAHGLYSRAIGAEWTEQQAFKVKTGLNQEKVEVVDVRKAAPPDTAAAYIWLKNRQPERWRDKPAEDDDTDLPEPKEIVRNRVSARKPDPDGDA